MGEISYNVNTRYKNNERCLWVIQGENKGDSAEIKVQVTKEGFEYQYDYLSLSYFPPNGGHSSMKTILYIKFICHYNFKQIWCDKSSLKWINTLHKSTVL